MRLSRNKILHKALLLGIASYAGLTANPQNPTVVSGTATFSDVQPGILQVQAADRTIINWKEFSINSGETTKFILNNPSDAILNRVTGTNMSSLLGQLECDGHLYLINPNGILIGHGVLVDTQAFIASTLDVLDNDFLAGGELNFFTTSPGLIVNMGSIEAWTGDAILIGYQVENHGVLNAANGTAGIAAGKNIVLTAPGSSERILILPSQRDLNPKDVGIIAGGWLNGLEAELKADGNLYALAINQDGYINAKGVDRSTPGRVFLIADGGSVEVNNLISAVNLDETGGEIQIFAEDILLGGASNLKASGNMIGGTIEIGGSLSHEENHQISAKTTTVELGAYLNARAADFGDGGNIIIWSEDRTRFYGWANAAGGTSTGDGGKIFIGSAGNLEFQGAGYTLADFGSSGTLFLGAPSLTIKELKFTDYRGNTLDNQNLIQNMWRGHVHLSALGKHGKEGDLVLQDPLIWSAASNLVMQASGKLSIHASLQYWNKDQNSTTVLIGKKGIKIAPYDNSLLVLGMPDSSLAIRSDGKVSIYGGDVEGGAVKIDCGFCSIKTKENCKISGGSVKDAFVHFNETGQVELDVYGSLQMMGGFAEGADVLVPETAKIQLHAPVKAH